MNLCKEIISKDNYEICTRFKVDSRKCQNPDHYESYIRYDALQSVKDGMGTTYLYINALENGARDLMGYISLRFSSYIKDYGESKKFGFSALEIAELAVSLPPVIISENVKP